MIEDEDGGTPAADEEAPYDAADEKQVARQRRVAALRDKQKVDFLRRILDDPIGRRWLWELMAIDCHVNEPRMSPDSHVNAWWAGEREVGLRLMRALRHASPELFTVMLTEHDRG